MVEIQQIRVHGKFEGVMFTRIILCGSKELLMRDLGGRVPSVEGAEWINFERDAIRQNQNILRNDFSV